MKDRVVFLVLGLMVLASYVHKNTKGTWRFTTLKRDAVATVWYHYGALAEGFRKGQLSLSVEPSKEILAVENPYLRRNRKPGTYIWDASLYKGKYYLYFSPVPVLLFHLPSSYLFNAYLDQGIALILFLSLYSIFLFLTVRELYRDRRDIPVWIWALLLLLFGIANGGRQPLGIATWYVLAISAGSMWTAISLYLCARILKRGATTLTAFLTAVGMSLAFWSRPPLGILFAFVFYFGYLAQKKRFAWSYRILAVYVVTACAGLSVVGTYNYLRFENPLNFGIEYQLGVNDPETVFPKRTVADFFELEARALPYFLFSFPRSAPRGKGLVPAWSDPVSVPPEGSKLTVEPMIGVLGFCPFALFVLLLIPALFDRRMRNREAIQFSASGLAVGFVVMAAVMSFAWVAARYVMDFMPFVLLASAISFIEWRSVLSPEPRGALAATAVILGAISITVCLLL